MAQRLLEQALLHAPVPAPSVELIAQRLIDALGARAAWPCGRPDRNQEDYPQQGGDREQPSKREGCSPEPQHGH
jgi:hypothetical protein